MDDSGARSGWRSPWQRSRISGCLGRRLRTGWLFSAVLVAGWLVSGFAHGADATGLSADAGRPAGKELDPPNAGAERSAGEERTAADGDQGRSATREPTAGERALAGTAAVFPGAIVHGTGNYVLGRPETGTPLLWLELAGLGIVGGSLTGLALTGAARGLAGLLATASVGGVGLFAVSWLGDIYSVVAPTGGWGQAARTAPSLESELGYRYVYDPRFEYRHFGITRLRTWLRRLRLSSSLWAAPGDGNSRLQLAGAYRAWGPVPTRSSADGSYVELELGAAEHRYPRERFALTTVEWQAQGRLDLQRLVQGLTGSFAEFGAGTAYQVTRFEVAGADSTAAGLLLARFGFGFYVGDQSSGGGEWQVFYDHRHDGYAAGLLLPRGMGGAIGHIGVSGHHFFDRAWGVGAEAQVGAAYVLGVSARFRSEGGR